MKTGWFAIAKTGWVKDSSGKPHYFDRGRLQRIAANFQKPDHKAVACCKGHPKTDDPAYAWISDVKTVGNRLYARAKDVSREFADWVKAKKYNFVSPSIRPDDTLKHVGFLGATPPAFPGLGEVSPAFAHFEESPDDITVEYDFEEPRIGQDILFLLDSIRDLVSKREHAANMQEQETEAQPEDKDEANGTLDDENKNKNEKENSDMPNQNTPNGDNESPPNVTGSGGGKQSPVADYAEQLTAADVARVEAEKQRDLAIAELNKLKAASKEKRISDFAEGMVAGGKLAPKQKSKAVKFLTLLDDQATHDFSDSDDENDEKTILDVAMEFLEEAGSGAVPLDRLPRTRKPATDNDEESADYSEADPTQAKLDRMARQIMHDKGCSYRDALIVAKGGKK